MLGGVACAEVGQLAQQLAMILDDLLLLPGDTQDISLADLGRDGRTFVDDGKARAWQIAGTHKTRAFILARALPSHRQTASRDGPTNRDILHATNSGGIG